MAISGAAARSSILRAIAFVAAACMASAAEDPTPSTTEASDLRRAIDEQKRLVAEQQAQIDAQRAQLDAMLARLEDLTRRLDESAHVVPGAAPITAPKDTAAHVPELPTAVVSAGDFPGSIRIPGSDAAIKFGGRIRAAGVFTLSPLGTDDRFETNSIPTDDLSVAGDGKRTTMSAAGSRFNVEVRTPVGKTHVRSFIEGDFAGPEETFRLRHAYAQFRHAVIGQTWSTFSDPHAPPEDLDFEGISSENLVRQTQLRWEWRRDEAVGIALAAEFPRVSLTGGEGVNLMPDVIGRLRWRISDTSHLQFAALVRSIRGEFALAPGNVQDVNGWGVSLSGAFPFHFRGLTDRFVFQITRGEGVARYINDLNKLGGQDAWFDAATGDLVALEAWGWYFDYEHMWKRWQATRDRNLRSSLIWSRVGIDNEDFQPGDAYRQTDRFTFNLIFSPIPRIDIGAEYITGRREDKDGESGRANQFQFVSVFRF
jgi:hypothetical protein